MGNSEVKVKLSSPWENLYHEITAMFGRDEDIKNVINDDENEIRLYVTGQDKADALTALLPSEYQFGNIVVNVEIIPSNEKLTKSQLYRKAFDGNPVFSFAQSVEGIMTNPIHYVVFAREVVTYFNDNLHDIYGNINTLYENIAKDLFGESDGVCFCTETDKK